MRPSTLTSRLASERGTATATFWTADIPRVIRNASGGREHPCRGSVRIAGCLNMEGMGEAYPLPSLTVDPPDVNWMATQQLMSHFWLWPRYNKWRKVALSSTEISCFAMPGFPSREENMPGMKYHRSGIQTSYYPLQVSGCT